MKIYAKQPLISLNFTDMNGNTWPIEWINCYNNLTIDINKSADIHLKTNSLTAIERNFLLDQRHKNYVLFCNIANNRS